MSSSGSGSNSTEVDPVFAKQSLVAGMTILVMFFISVPSSYLVGKKEGVSSADTTISDLESRLAACEGNGPSDAYQLAAEHWLAQVEAIREYERTGEFSPTANPNTFTFYLDHDGNELGEWGETWVYEYHAIMHEEENPTISVVRNNAQQEHL
jgi:hypothetical protein